MLGCLRKSNLPPPRTHYTSNLNYQRCGSPPTIIPSLNAQIISVAFLYSDAVLSARVTNPHAAAYIHEELKLKTQPVEETQDFLPRSLPRSRRSSRNPRSISTITGARWAG